MPIPRKNQHFRVTEYLNRKAEDVADLGAILQLIETEALHEAAEAIDCLDMLVRDQIPIRLYDAIVLGN